MFILRYLKILLKGIYSISGFPCFYEINGFKKVRRTPIFFSRSGYIRSGSFLETFDGESEDEDRHESDFGGSC